MYVQPTIMFVLIDLKLEREFAMSKNIDFLLLFSQVFIY